jgi:hypothetical protein
VAHTCNPKHFKGRDEEDQIWDQPRKRLARPHLNKQAGCGGMLHRRQRQEDWGLRPAWAKKGETHLKNY